MRSEELTSSSLIKERYGLQTAYQMVAAVHHMVLPALGIYGENASTDRKGLI